MFTVLNRFRGTEGYWAKIVGVVLGLIFGIATGSWLIGVLTAIAYVLGESMGWGKWMGGIINGIEKADDHLVADLEGTRNGIHYIANKIFPEREKYQEYCITALGIRGFYWWGITLLPLAAFGYISVPVFLIASLLLGIAFPLSLIIGKITAKKFSFEKGYFKMIGAWEHSEVIYGAFQDIGIAALLILL